jgi:hypothetical protein
MLGGSGNLSGTKVAVAPLELVAVALLDDNTTAGTKALKAVPLIVIVALVIADEAV